MNNSSIFIIEHGGTGIEKGGTGVEKGGTGIEKGGTGVEKGGTGIEKGGTGCRPLGWLRMAAFGLLMGSMVSTSALAAPGGTWEDWGDVGGTVQFGVKADTLTASWSTFDQSGNPVLLVGTGEMTQGIVNMRLFKIESGYHGRNAEPMPFMQPWGRAKLNFDGCGNAHGTVSTLKVEGSGTGDKVEGSGTGDKVEGSGTGDKVEGSGTGDKVEGSGTGDKVEGSGTGDKVEGSGTGDKFAFYGDVILVGPGKDGGCQ
jgi:hypothetical protein